MDNPSQKNQRKKLWVLIVLFIIFYTIFNSFFINNVKPKIQSLSPIEFPSVFFTFSSVLILLPLIFLWVKWDKDLTWQLIFGQSQRSFWQSYNRASLYLLLVFISSEIFSLWLLRDYLYFEYVWDIHYWLIFLLPMLIIIFFQVFAEETLFRGIVYNKINQLYTKKLAIIVPSLIWGFAHFGNINNHWLAIFLVAQMSVLGIILSDWRILTGSLIEPIMVHFINNVFFGLIYGSNFRHYSTQIWQAQFVEMPDFWEGFYVIFPILPMVGIYWIFRENFIKS